MINRAEFCRNVNSLSTEISTNRRQQTIDHSRIMEILFCYFSKRFQFFTKLANIDVFSFLRGNETCYAADAMHVIYIPGYILRKDALQLLADDKFDISLGSIKREIQYFNEDTSIGDIWEQFIAKKEQISVVIDEYGCFQGILTLEDILETILGLEIIDENDEVSDLQQYARERWQQRQKK